MAGGRILGMDVSERAKRVEVISKVVVLAVIVRQYVLPPQEGLVLHVPTSASRSRLNYHF